MVDRTNAKRLFAAIICCIGISGFATHPNAQSQMTPLRSGWTVGIGAGVGQFSGRLNDTLQVGGVDYSIPRDASNGDWHTHLELFAGYLYFSPTSSLGGGIEIYGRQGRNALTFQKNENVDWGPGNSFRIYSTTLKNDIGFGVDGLMGFRLQSNQWIYGLIGWTTERFRYQQLLADNTPSNQSIQTSFFRGGVAFGGGYARTLTNRFRLDARFRYVSFGPYKTQTAFVGLPVGSNSTITHTQKLDQWSFSLRLVYVI